MDVLFGEGELSRSACKISSSVDIAKPVPQYIVFFARYVRTGAFCRESGIHPRAGPQRATVAPCTGNCSPLTIHQPACPPSTGSRASIPVTPACTAGYWSRRSPGRRLFRSGFMWVTRSLSVGLLRWGSHAGFSRLNRDKHGIHLEMFLDIRPSIDILYPCLSRFVWTKDR